MSPAEVKALYAYNSWANRRIIGVAQKLTAQQFLAPVPSSFSSVRDTLAHIYGAELIWFGRFQGGTPPMPQAESFPDLKTLAEAWGGLEQRLEAFVAGLTQSALDTEMEYKTFTMGTVRDPLLHAMQHLVNHSTYHRGQVTTLLRQHGLEGISTDLIRFYREQAKAISA